LMSFHEVGAVVIMSIFRSIEVQTSRELFAVYCAIGFYRLCFYRKAMLSSWKTRLSSGGRRVAVD